MVGAVVDCRLLGGFALRLNDVEVTIRGTRSRQVFAYFALYPDSIIGVDRLADALWGDSLPASPRNSIQRFVSDLRRDLGSDRDRFESVGDGYRVRVRPDDVFDVHELERAVPLARMALDEERPADALAVLKTPDPMWHPLAGLEGANFAALEQLRLSELIADAVEVAADAHIANGNPDGAIALTRPMLERQPYRERLCVSLATGLSRAGRSNDALDTITMFGTRLRADLGLDPSPVVNQAELDILLHSGDQADVAKGRHSEPVHERATVFGRTDLVDRAVELLDSERLVTLMGVGGIGKTTLIAPIVGEWHRRNGGTSRSVPLEGVSAQGLVAAIGQASGTSASFDADSFGEVIDRIISDVDLLVLDNCEHLTDELARVLEALAGADSVRVLATSRVSLALPQEQLVMVGSLDRSASQSMLERHMEKVAVRPAEVEEAAVVELLDELDGMPLAIELAAASLRSMGARELLGKLRESDTAPRLASKADRHHSISNAIDSTLGQLEADSMNLLRLASMFPSDFGLAGLEALTGESVVRPLQNLIDQSLLELRRTTVGARYRMLVPVRSEVRSRSAPGSIEEQTAFVAHYASFAAYALDRIKGTDSRSGVADLNAELTNTAFALELAIELDDHDSVADIVESLGVANSISSEVGATSHLQDWVRRIRLLLPTVDEDSLAGRKLRRAAVWALHGAGDGLWYLRWEKDVPSDDPDLQALAALASYSTVASTEAWERLYSLDLVSAKDPYFRAMFCGMGSVIAYQFDADYGASLVAAAIDAAAERESHGASFYAALARSTQAFVAGDAASSIGWLDGALAAVDGRGLASLENFARACVVTTASLMCQERDAVPLLVDLLNRYLEQHSLDPLSVATTFDVIVLTLDQNGQTKAAATLLGLLDRLHLSLAMLRPWRAKVEHKVAGDAEWAQARAAGSMKSTFDVLRETRDSLELCLVASP